VVSAIMESGVVAWESVNYPKLHEILLQIKLEHYHESYKRHEAEEGNSSKYQSIAIASSQAISICRVVSM